MKRNGDLYHEAPHLPLCSPILAQQNFPSSAAVFHDQRLMESGPQSFIKRLLSAIERLSLTSVMLVTGQQGGGLPARSC